MASAKGRTASFIVRFDCILDDAFDLDTLEEIFLDVGTGYDGLRLVSVDDLQELDDPDEEPAIRECPHVEIVGHSTIDALQGPNIGDLDEEDPDDEGFSFN